VALCSATPLVDFVEQSSKLEIDGGAFEGQIFQAEQVKALARMPGVDALRARVVRQALFPASRIASAMSAPAQRLAGAIEALVKRLEDSEAQ
jgi:large subunit ribosomal protein L10